MNNKVKIFLLDVFFGWYLAITFHRVFYYHVLLSTDSPDFTWNLMLPYVGVAMIFGIICVVSGASLGKKIISSTQKGTWQNEIAINIAWILILMTFVTSWVVTKVNIIQMFDHDRLNAAGRLFSSLLQPNWNILQKAIMAMIETIYLAFLSTAIALPVSFLLGFLSARNLMKGNPISFALYNILRIITNFTRSIEPLVWAVIFTVWVSSGPFPGMLALMIHTIASLAKQYSEQIEDIDAGPMEAIEATGARPIQVIWFAVVPQIVIPFLSFTIYRWDINVRMATIIGLVGGGGIGSMLIQYQMLSQWNEVGLIVLIIALVVWLMDYLSAKIREALR